MERVRRRWWTWSVSIFAVLVILAAAISGAFQLAVLELPSYRNQLSDWVTRVAGRPVDISGVSLVWRGIYPWLDLSGITLYSDDGEDEVLTADRLSLGFGLLRLATGDFTPVVVELSGASLAVNVDADGNVSIVGLEAQQSAKPNYEEWLRSIAHLKHVRLLDCDLQVTAPQLPDTPLQLHLASAEAWQTFRGLEAKAHLDLPPNYGQALDFDADIDGAVEKPQDWSGTFDTRISNLQPQPWLRKWVWPDTRLGAGNANLDLRGGLKSGHLNVLDVQLQTGTVLAGRGAHDTVAKSLNLLARATAAPDGWQVDLRQLALDGVDQARGGLHYAPLASGTGFDLSVDADLLHLDRLAPWLAYWRDAPRLAAMAAHATGELDGLSLHVHDSDTAQEYSLQAALKDIGYVAGSGPVGFAGLNGELTASESGGRLILDGTPLTLYLPHALRNPASFDTLSGQAQWNRQAHGWQVSMPSFAWTLLGTSGQGQLGLQLPDDPDQSPQLDLSAQFSAEDVTRAKTLIPIVWGEGLNDWLKRAVVSASVPHGDLEIHGPLADFPYSERQTGSWKLDLDVANGHLDYLPDWPGVEGLKAHLAFSGDSLSIDADAGSLGDGTHIQKVSARIPDFHQALLQIDGTVSGETARFYDFLKASPLKKTLAGLVNNTSASGPAQVNLHLDIPLKHAEHVDVSGDVVLDAVQLNYKGLAQPVKDIRGDIRFSPEGVSSDSISGRFEDVDLAGSIVPREGTEGVITAGFDYAVNAAGSGVSSFVPALVRKTLSGGSHWNVELPLGSGDDLALSTDLQGIAIALPAPLGKSANEIVPLTVMIGDGGGNAMRVRAVYHDRLDAEVALAPDATGWSVTGMNLHLGQGFAASATGEGVYVNGSVDSLDVGAWDAVLRAAGKGNGSLPLQQVDIHADRLLLMGQMLHDVHAVYTPNATGWTAAFDGTGAEGSLTWRDIGGGVLDGQFKHLDVDFQPPPPDSPSATTTASVSPLPPQPQPVAAPPTDPAQLPLVDISSDQFSIGEANLGQLRFVTQRIDGGQKIGTLQLGGGNTTLTASGAWTRLNGQSSAALKFDLQTQDIAALLRAFGYAPNLDAKSSHFTGDLNWAPSASGLVWELARGPVTVDVKNGKLKAVEPGAGRVLGLLNFYALPRRLLLDFRDVVSSGLGFDTITGSFDLADGVANTQNLDIAGPSLHMEVRGKVGLLARDFDQTVKVYPNVSSGITLGAALLGGPAVGIVVLVAQYVLKTPLNKVTQLDYHVTGPWDNPKIE